MIEFEEEHVPQIPVYNPTRTPQVQQPPHVQVHSNYNPFDVQTLRTGTMDWDKMYQNFEAERAQVEIAPESSFLPDPEMVAEKVPSGAEENRLFENETSGSCYQYKGRYIVTSLKSGLALVDQHRAHIRILFDQYLANIRQRKGASQQVLFPEMLELTTDEAAVLPWLLDDLRFIGFDLVDEGNNNYSIQGVPVGVENLDPALLLRDMIDQAGEIGCDVQEEVCRSLALSLARAAAIPSGKSLSLVEMDHLLAALFSCPESNLTPDGKTIVTLLTDEELEKRF